MTPDPLLLSTARDILSRSCTPDNVRAAELASQLPAALVAAFLDTGLHHVGVEEGHGGVGGSQADAAALLREAGRFACPLPLAEQALMGGWLMQRVGAVVPDGLYTTAVQAQLTLVDGRVNGSAVRVPWLPHVEEVVSLTDDGHAVRLRVADLEVTNGKNLAGEPRSSFTARGVAPVCAFAAPEGGGEQLRARAAATRTLLLAGACDRILRLCVRYAAEREQFGRPINSFQAVATHLARIAEETALVSVAADLVTQALTDGDITTEAAFGKVVAGESASTVARLAHQVHGAIGVTAEYELQLHTRRVLSWRDEHGSEAVWAREVGDRLVAAGPERAWDLVVAHPGGDR